MALISRKGIIFSRNLPLTSPVQSCFSMSSPYSRSSSNSSRGSWKRQSSAAAIHGSQGYSTKKAKLSDEHRTPNQRSITSYFSPKLNLSASSQLSPTFAKSSSEGLPATKQYSPAPASQMFLSQSTIDTIIIDNEEDWETDSQKTEVLTQLDPLMSDLIESSQTEPAQAHTLYYLDELDEMLHYYDVDAVAEIYRLKQKEKEPQSGSHQRTQSLGDPSVAYYLTNFMAILTVVEEKDKHLFSSEELRVFQVLRQSAVSEQKLFSRLLYRKGPWFQVSKLNYADIPDIESAIAGLIAVEIFEEPTTVVDILPTLNNQQLRQLTKSSSGLRRDQLLAAASKWVTNQKTLDGRSIRPPKEVGQCIRIKGFVDTLFKRVHRLFFLNQVEDQTTLILIHTGQIRFPTYLILDNKKTPLHHPSTDVENPQSSALNESQLSYELSYREPQDGPTPPMSPSSTQDLQSFLFSDKNASESSANLVTLSDQSETLENVHILRKSGFYSVFKTRADLDEYEEALTKSHQLMELLGSDIDVDNDTTDNDKRRKQTPNAKNLNDRAIVAAAMAIVEDSVLKYQEKRSMMDNSVMELQSEELGSHLFLNRFTALWVYTSIIWVGVSLLERQKRYSEAIVYLKMLLDQYEVNRGRRGEFWIRLVFDVAHLKQTEHAIELCCQAIRDDNCRPQHLLKLYDKLRILIKAQERERAKLEKESLKRQKEQNAAMKVDLMEETEEASGFVTPQRKSRRGNARVKTTLVSAATPSSINSSNNSTPSSASLSPKTPTTPISNSPRSISPTARGRRTTRVPIPLPGEAMEAPSQAITSNDHLKELMGLGTPPSSTYNGTHDAPARLTDSTVVDDTIPGRSRSPPKSYIPSVRHTSPIRFDEITEAKVGASPTRTLPNQQFQDISIQAEEDAALVEGDDDDVAEMTSELIARLTELNIPLPGRLNPGQIETITGAMGQRAVGYGFGTKSVFIDFSGNPCGVEEYSLQYYQASATPTWPKGCHCEGSPYFALYALLFWDIIFDVTIPYVFQTPYQDAPLDMTTEAFYISRKEAIDERLKMIYFSSQDPNSPVARKIQDSYFKWHGRSCRGIDWGRWKIYDLLDIARCLGGPVLSMFCERFAIDYRFTHSGLPDLLLWNPEANTAKLVEVKGPNDKLSEKQKIWIDALARRGCNIVTLYVKGELPAVASDPPAHDELVVTNSSKNQSGLIIEDD